ncbi:hypothetical protein [Brachyspira innocens]|uniref:hypothetical protein n=1 Tax=Brachyspira innocens TaxID=13264 RepID=UPI0026F2E2E9|nr:hypothetical protein [Brachyspira innocens]
MRKIRTKKNGIYLIFAFVSIIFFYISINVLYTQTTSSSIYDEDLINNLPNAERFAKNIKISASETNSNTLIIEWDGVNDGSIVYYLYRSISPIIGKSSLIDSSVVDYIKATNDSKHYYVLDRPILSSKYYYAVVSYADDLIFYSARDNVDTSSIVFNGFSNIKTYTNNNLISNNNLSYTNNTNSITNTVFDNNITTNTYVQTNVYSITNVYSLTNIYSVTNRYNITNNNNTSASSLISKYNSDYNRALAEFKNKNYLLAANILEPISTRNINNDIYYKINLLLGKCYKYLGRKNNALGVFNRIKTYNAQEVNFWINQVLSDL